MFFISIVIVIIGIVDMAILYNPLFSDEARGTVAQCITFKRGVFHPIARFCSYTPTRWTSSRIASSELFLSLCSSWRALSPYEKQSWSSIAPGVLTGFNYFIKCGGIYP